MWIAPITPPLHFSRPDCSSLPLLFIDMEKEKKHLSTIANIVIQRCAQKLGSSVDSLIEEFEREWEPQMSGYSRKLVEFCCSKALMVMCGVIDDTITDGSFSRFTFDMMLAWESPSSEEEETYSECIAKESEEKKVAIATDEQQDDVSLFYSDLMPLLVDREPSAGEDAFVWLGTLVPLVVDMVNGRFTFETLTAPTGNRLHFPAYDKFLKEIDRLTLTNYALYFEASGVISYENALKLDLSKDVGQNVKPVATGPWGAPLFDKAIVYESSEFASSILRSLNVSRPCVPCVEPQQTSDSTEIIHPENLSSLESAINQAREEAKETDLAKSTAGALKEEGISQSAQVLIGLLKPLQILVPWSQEIVMWERPMTTSMVVITTLIVIYKEFVGLAISAFLLWAVATMLRARRERIAEKRDKIVICTASDQSTMESIISAQQGLRSVHEIMQQTNIALLKIWSILISKAPKHTNTVMIVMAACAIVLAVIPLKFILMALVVYGFFMTSKLGKCMQSEQGNRRMKEWWDSIPIVPLEIVD
ncbi:UNVERIFIED_CONTAM: hypothetical protein Sradi_3387000 [Sesamum radiatum]|uniref:Uncharacterized protein n=1 Tax=Sesamum radiatum TaxID=300843 RepID=A0AAW2R444_SESRA